MTSALHSSPINPDYPNRAFTNAQSNALRIALGALEQQSNKQPINRTLNFDNITNQ